MSLHKLLNRLHIKWRYSKDYWLIASTSLFDKSWYLNAYPDVSASGIDPVRHYLNHGGAERRNPGPLFDTFYYLAQLSKVQANIQATDNPLLHYLKVGKQLGLKPTLPKKHSLERNVSLFNKVFSKLTFRLKPLSGKISSINHTFPEFEPIDKLPLTVLVIAWDVGHNPLGRSYMLSEVMERVVNNVVLCGFQFSSYGNDIWSPVRNGVVPVISLPGGEMGEWLESCERAVQKFKPDVVIACKPRLPSVELGILFKEKYNIPLIIDVDDYELSFFKNAQPFSIDDIKAMPDEELNRHVQPFGEIWTRVTDSLTRNYADAIITSNVALQREFGGEIIPHVRDEATFDLRLYSKQTQREKYAIPLDAHVVMFFGTPRAHKGVDEIAKAVGKIKRINTILVIVGDEADSSVINELSDFANGKLVYLPSQPFNAIPEVMVMADLVVLPQDIHHPISKFQLPAKAIDAIAMGVPLWVSATEPLMQLVNDGVAKLLPNIDLDKAIEKAFTNMPTSADLSVMRRRFLLSYSYHSAALKLKEVVEQVLQNKPKPLTGFNEFKRWQKTLFPVAKSAVLTKGTDIILFWKQNDTGLYGRRSDMVVKYLASRADVRKVIVFDAPLSLNDVSRLKTGDFLIQNHNIYIKTYEKLLGKLDRPKISYNVFLYATEGCTLNEMPEGKRISLFDTYSTYLQKVLSIEGVDNSKAVFWIYPKIPLVEQIIDLFKPNKIVVDIVDDHRAWPNVSKEMARQLTEHYRTVLAKADMAFANCQSVVDSMKSFKADIQLIPNGCEDSPEITAPYNHILYEELKVFKGKVIGFVGNLESKIDIPLIEKIAEAFPDTLIVLVGSTHANPKVRDLRRYSNIRMFGVVPYEYINAVVGLFDVGILPHLKMDLTKNMNPLKVYVYLANHVPVVATDVENVESSCLIYRAVNHDDFIAGLKENLNDENRLDASEFSRFIANNTWAKRFEGLSFD